MENYQSVTGVVAVLSIVLASYSLYFSYKTRRNLNRLVVEEDTTVEDTTVEDTTVEDSD